MLTAEEAGPATGARAGGVPAVVPRRRFGRSPNVLRRWSAGLRVLPGALIIGAQRAGTTSCFKYLAQHPLVLAPLRKEIHYFDRDDHYRRGQGWYRAHFPTRGAVRRLAARLGSAPLAIEATPAYLFQPRAAERMARLLPEARLIVLLRDPVARAHSGYKLALELGLPCGSFEDEVEHEIALEERRAPVIAGRRDYKLLARGRYAEQLLALFRHYPRERVMVLESERLLEDPRATCDAVFRFLDVPPHAVERSRAYNSIPSAELEERTRSRLQEYYREPNRRLVELLGRPFEWAVESPRS